MRVALVRLAVFAALGLFAAAHWATLVSSPPVGRTVLVVLVATATAALMLGTSRLRPSLAAPAAALVGLAGLALGLVAMGLELRLLFPGNWDELFDGLDRGLAGVQTAEWPYDGVDSGCGDDAVGRAARLRPAALLAFFRVAAEPC